MCIEKPNQTKQKTEIARIAAAMCIGHLPHTARSFFFRITHALASLLKPQQPDITIGYVMFVENWLQPYEVVCSCDNQPVSVSPSSDWRLRTILRGWTRSSLLYFPFSPALPPVAREIGGGRECTIPLLKAMGKPAQGNNKLTVSWAELFLLPGFTLLSVPLSLSSETFK